MNLASSSLAMAGMQCPRAASSFSTGPPSHLAAEPVTDREIGPQGAAGQQRASHWPQPDPHQNNERDHRDTAKWQEYDGGDHPVRGTAFQHCKAPFIYCLQPVHRTQAVARMRIIAPLGEEIRHGRSRMPMRRPTELISRVMMLPKCVWDGRALSKAPQPASSSS